MPDTTAPLALPADGHRRSQPSMPKALRRTANVGAAGAIVAALSLSGAAAAPSTQPHGLVLRYDVEFSQPNLVDVPPVQQHDGDYLPGDYVTFGDVLRDARGKQVGTEAGTGMITRLDSTSVQVFYSMAIQLPGGQLAAQGIASNAPDKHLVITGGTGSYLGAVGDLRLVENGDGTGSLTLSLR